MFSEILTHLIEEPLQVWPWDVYLSDHFSRRIRSVELIVDLAMVIFRVDTQLVQISPIHLAIGREIVVCVSVERLFLICVREVQELLPVLVGQLLLCYRYWRIHCYWPVAGKNTFVEKVFRGRLDGELEIAILKSVSNALLKRNNQVVYCPNFHHPLDLFSRHEAQLHGRNDSKEAVSAVNQAK